MSQNRDNNLNLNLSKEEKKQVMDEIKFYFEEERGEEIGIIASENFLDFFLNNLGKYIYNKALDDAKIWYESRMGNMESDYYAIYK
ncbi:DUF2164 family protein [Natronospora cellulosivora (SeqCode)]